MNQCQTRVIGVPKTIDGDLKNACVAISFGFDTATKTYAELIGNLAKDTLSDKKYYHFIKLMGRSASHVALECALATHPNLVFIGEEKKKLQEIIDETADLIIKRAKIGKKFGIVLISEGLIEFIPEMSLLIEEIGKSGVDCLSAASRAVWDSLPEKIQKQFLLGRDSHGNLNVSAIETDTLLIEMVRRELKKRNFEESFFPVPHFFGYEGRSALPSNFDATYGTVLGFTAALLVRGGHTGYMCYASSLTDSSSQWMVGGVPLTALMHFEIRKGKKKPVVAKTLVNLEEKPYLTYLKQKEAWKIEDSYIFPGPIQFFGDPQLTDKRPISIL
jgi:pyrophosphate--fructose-6-phosphate 1-phosphotransferase